MASLAGLLCHMGFTVTGSDRSFYPPMSTFIDGLGIDVFREFGPKSLAARPDLVVVGNVITRDNPEALELARLEIPYLSFPQALAAFMLNETKPVVVCGTHGKTTTASLAAWLLSQADLDPSFMIGGIPVNFESGFRLGAGTYSVVEGDEYDTAFFDKGPKFLHYRPQMAILTSIEFDHADIYRDLDHLKGSFRKLIEIIPSNGLLIANGDDPEVLDLASAALCPVITYGFSRSASVSASGISVKDGITRLQVHTGAQATGLATPLYGRHNMSNLLAVTALSGALGLSVEVLSRAVSSFRGIKRRQEVVGESSGITVLDDFAHHPTAVKATIRAVKERYPGRRLLAVFEPRSNSSRRNVFQQAYAKAFGEADMVFIPEPSLMEKIPPEERFSSLRLVADLKKTGVRASYCGTTDELLDTLTRSAETGDVVLVMSNGAFDNLPRRLVDGL